jgi:uncharacterized protein YkwD
MRVLTWLGGIVVVVALGWGATSVAHHSGDSALTASRHVAATSASSGLDYTGDTDILPRHVKPQPSPVPAPAAPPAAAPAAAPPPARPAPPPPAAIVVRSTQQTLINQDRARYGLAPLTWNSCLDNVAVSNARRMSAQGFISHTNGPYADLSCGLTRQAGENVGDWSGGVDDSQLNTMFMNSADHRANILGPYHYVATAWAVDSRGYGYIAVEFS